MVVQHGMTPRIVSRPREGTALAGLLRYEPAKRCPDTYYQANTPPSHQRPIHNQPPQQSADINCRSADAKLAGASAAARLMDEHPRASTRPNLRPPCASPSSYLVSSQLLAAAEGDDEGVIDGADGSAGFVGIVAASTSTCRSPFECGCTQVVTLSSAAAPLPLLGAARLRCGSACHRPLRAPRAPRRG
jgi:hypothetical protein